MITIDNLDRNPILAEYDNGNCHVRLHQDGTKIRECDSVPAPELPESIDLKITDYCDVGCPYCHEGSSTNGLEAKIDDVLHVLEQLRPGTEIAIGGGDPLSSTSLPVILGRSKELGLVSNMTVRLESLLRDNGLQLSKVNKYRRLGLVYGVGISGAEGINLYDQIFSSIADTNTTLHFIIGVDSPQRVIQAIKHYKVLILGFKQVGRGNDYYPVAKDKIGEWKYWAPRILSGTNSIVSFDNLAIEQLNLRNIVSPDDWKSYYMGGEGEFTMYIDAVADQYAISSASDRWPVAGKTVKEMFDDVRARSGYQPS